MNRTLHAHWLLGALILALYIAWPLSAQDAARTDGAAAPDAGRSAQPQKIVPVQVLRDFELGPELEIFSSSSNRILERREKSLAEAVWKIDGRTTLTPVAIIVRDVVRTSERRLGGRLDYFAAADSSANLPEERSSQVLDIEELKDLEVALNSMLRAMEQPPSRSEVINWRYRSRSGFLASLTLTRDGDNMTVIAAVGKIRANSRDGARAVLEQSATIVHRLINELSGY